MAHVPELLNSGKKTWARLLLKILLTICFWAEQQPSLQSLHLLITLVPGHQQHLFQQEQQQLAQHIYKEMDSLQQQINKLFRLVIQPQEQLSLEDKDLTQIQSHLQQFQDFSILTINGALKEQALLSVNPRTKD